MGVCDCQSRTSKGIVGILIHVLGMSPVLVLSADPSFLSEICR